MDVYRLSSPEDFLDLGIEDMLYGRGVCIIEWSEKIMSELPTRTILIHIGIEKDSSRTITITNWPYQTGSLIEYTCNRHPYANPFNCSARAKRFGYSIICRQWAIPCRALASPY